MTQTARSSAPLLQVRNLVTAFATEGGMVRVVDGVSLHVNEGETLGLVGESGCGKSVTALSLMRLIPNPPGRILGGEAILEGRDLLRLSEREMRGVRGSRMAMIFQEPMTSLNPVLTIGRQLTEPLELHLRMSRATATARAAELLEMVGVPDAGDRLKDYPHTMSGGQRQRVMIAMALSCRPKLLIADEATTALDVTIQAQILELMMTLTREFGTALIIITHNLGVIARYADRVSVMYAGRIREESSADDIYSEPAHPYTVGLLNSVPRFDADPDQRLQAIEGDTPDPAHLPSGCAFRPRCAWAVERCASDEPPPMEAGRGHTSACWELARVVRDRPVVA